MKILVTGATGFVGKAVVAELAKRGLDVIAVGGPGAKDLKAQPHGTGLLSINVADKTSVQSLTNIGAVDAVVHCAGLAHRFGKTTDEEFQSVNVGGVENVARLGASLGTKHFVLLSSTLVYGRSSSAAAEITEKDECHPKDAYGQSKLDGERAAQMVCEKNGMALTILRPAPIIGEGSKGNFARLIRSINNRTFIWVGSGKNLKSLVYVGDAAKAVSEVLSKHPAGTSIFNLSADAVRMKDIVGAIERELGRTAWPLRLPAALVTSGVDLASKLVFRDKFKRISSTLATWLSSDVYSNESLKQVCGFKPETDIPMAIKLEAAYYLKHK